MGSWQGPCNHCGVKISPHWRNGPPEKLVLCNACGLWYSRKRTLENYAPNEQLCGLKRRIRKSDAIVHVPSCAADPTATKCTSLMSVISRPQNSTILKKADEEQIPGNSRNRSGTTLTDLSRIKSLQMDPCYTVEHVPDSTENVVLIYNANTLLVSPNEIGLGAVLLKPPSSNFNMKDGPKDESKDQSKVSSS